MTYAGAQRMLDADSHLMELPGFLDPFIERDMRDRLKRREMTSLAPMLDAAAEAAERRRADPQKRAEAEDRLLRDKGWSALGAFDSAERTRALDLFGFDGQLVFATFATAMFVGRDEDLLYAGSAAHNRAVAAFCEEDPRLLPVSFVPLVDPERAVRLLEEAIGLGSGAVHVPSTAAGERAPTHPDLDPFWRLLNDSGIPFVLHIGGGGRLMDRAFHNNGRPVSDHLGGGENIRSKDFLAISSSPSVFLGALILDGLFDRFPNIRGAAIEEGASWVVSWLRTLDHAQRAFRRTEEPLRELKLPPSEYVKKHLKFTPFAGEPVGWMIEQAGAELFMFSTDFPHPEGGRDPLAKFEAEMASIDDHAKQRFFYDNMAELLGPSLVPKESRPRAT
jgi:predicted TIM-barrel fold metal-dependent hydrolase